MMKKTVVLVTALLLTTMLAVAQDQVETLEQEEPPVPEERPEVSTGWFTPDSALYGLETAWDNAGMRAGFKSPGDVAEKRAAEAEAMINAGNSEAAGKATRGLEKAANRAGENDLPGLERAQNRLQTVMENAPEEAREGLQNAMNNVQQNRERAGGPPSDIGPNGEEPGAPEDLGPENGEEPGSTEGEQPEDTERQEADGEEPNSDTAGPENRQSQETTEESEDVRTVVVEGGNYYFESDNIEVEVGEEVEFVFENQGGQHDLVIPNYNVGTDVINTGESDSFIYSFDETGEYDFICSVGNHAQQGMTGTIEVVEA